MAINTVIFDLDGTLLNTLDDLKDSVNFALSKYNYPTKTLDDVRNAVGNGVGKLIERLIPNGIDNTNYQECLNTFKENYSKNMYNKTKVYDGIIEMLKSLKARNMKTAIVSNKFDSAVKQLCERYFDGLIDIAIGQQENIDPKPSPTSLLKVITELNTTAEQCLYIGDSEVDIQTANNAGIDCISIVWGYKNIDFLYEHGATTLIYSPNEILDLI